MHQLLRRALRSARPDSIRRAHQTLEQRYRALAAGGDFTARLEQIYHAGQLDPRRRSRRVGERAWTSAWRPAATTGAGR